MISSSAISPARVGAIIATVVLLMTAQPAAATQYNPPWADIFGSQWNDLQTDEAAHRLSDQLQGSGYERYVDMNKTARMSMGTAYAQSDAIWVHFGHSQAGAATFCNQPFTANCYTWLYANTAQGTCPEPNACLSTYTSQIRDIRLMLFAGCHSGLDGKPGTLQDANLLDVARVVDGVDNAYGFSALVYWPMGNDYATFAGIELKSGSTINYGLWKAGQEVKNRWFGDAHGWNTLVGGGYINDAIIPAAYGRQ
jgi:hypothetical protein